MKSLDEIIKSQTLVGSGYITPAGAKVIAEQYAEQFKPKWIGVNDRLPEMTNEKLGYSDYVLAYSDAFEWGKWFISRYDHQDEMWQYDSGHDQTHNPITYWMPLPEEPT